MSKAILVIGPHRSGTSCAAGILYHAGLFMGDRLMAPTDQNPKGFFEDMAFVDTCVSMNRHGIKQRYLDQFCDLVKQRECCHDLWGLKFPGLCEKAIVLAPMLSDYKVVCVNRDPWEVIKSNIEINRRHTGQIGWELHVKIVNDLFRMIEKRREFVAFTDKPVLHVEYKNLIKGEVNELIEFAELTPNKNQMQRVQNFITPSLKHY